MTGPKPLVSPMRLEKDDTRLFLAEHYVSTQQGDLEVAIYRAGYFLEAEVRRTHPTEPSLLVLSERITLEPTLQAWLKDLLDRAQKEES